jgi:hypothetical protein
MGKIAANTSPLPECVVSGSCRVGMFVTELDFIMHEVADRLYEGASLGLLAEGGPGEV